MAININLRNFYDHSSELIGIKSGLLLNRFQISSILKKNFNNSFLDSNNLNSGLRIHSSDYEDMLLMIRQQIGNLPFQLYSNKAYQYLREYVSKTGNIDLIFDAQNIGMKYLYKNDNISFTELINILLNEYNYNIELCLALATISLERNDLSCIPPENKEWNSATELSDLYKCELHSENNFLEQKFIDYLAVNGNEIEQIHWRNFEKFCAEYFKKKGYIINLGSGRNDGGVDIRAYKDGIKAPEFMIQCKRYKKENKISIETVKSFYTDVKFENAKHGLIATTSYIAPGGKKVCQTRGYNIKFAERENIKKWAKEMYTFK